MSEKQKWFMRLTIKSTDTGKAAFAMYPSDQYEKLESLDACGIPYGWSNYEHLAVSYNGVKADSLQVALAGVIEHQEHPPSVHELDFLASRIQSMTAEERDQMEQHLISATDPTIASAINLAHQVLGELELYDGISMADRPVLFCPDEPYIKVRLAPEDEAYISEEAGMWVDCPATKAELMAVAEKLGMKSYRDLEVCDAYGILENLANDMCQEDLTTFDELNALAQAMKDNEIHRHLAKYKAVLSLENCYDLREATALAGNLDNYEFYQESMTDVGCRYRAQNPYELDDDELAEDMGFEETVYGSVRKTDHIEPEFTGPTLC